MPIGCHVNKNNSSYSEEIQRYINMAKDANVVMECAQIFVIGPRNTKESVDDGEIESLRGLIDTAKIDLYVHGSYLDNPWGRRPALGIHLIRKELEICDAIGAKGLVVHLAKVPPGDIAAMLPKLLKGRMKSSKETKLFLEIESYKASQNTYEKPSKILNLFGLIEKEFEGVSADPFDYIGLCIDTAHLWAAGVDISTSDKVAKWLELVEESPIRHYMIHLNDQIWPKGSGRDEHAPLCYGTIWSDYHPNSVCDYRKSGLYEFMSWAESQDIPCVLERKPDKPKIDNKPEINNIESDFMIIGEMGFWN